MDGQQFALLKADIERQLTAEQCIEIEELAKRLLSSKTGEAAAARRALVDATDRRCPHCGAAGVVKHGKDDRGRQRFRCRKVGAVGCGKTWNGFTGTPLARMRKPELWLVYVREMTAPKSLNQIRSKGIPIARLTAWRWRRRFLALAVLLQAPKLDGIIEADETYFLRSFKGHRGWKNGTPPANRPPRYRGSGALKPGISAEQVAVLSALDRTGALIESVIKNRSSIEFDRVLGGRLAPSSILCVDGAPAYQSLAFASNVRLKVIPPATMTPLQKAAGGMPRRRGRLTLGRVNSHHAVLKAEINGELRGVSTRFLPEYLAWIRTVRQPGFRPETFIDTAVGRNTS